MASSCDQGRLEVEDEFGDTEVHDAAADVHDGGDEGGASRGRVHAHGAEEEREELADEATKHDDSDHSGADREGERKAATEPTEDKDDGGHREAEEKAEKDFADEKARPVAQTNFTCGHGAYGKGDALGASVTSAVHEQGEEEDERYHAGDDVFEVSDAGAGEDVNSDEAEEPAEAAADEGRDGSFAEACFEGADGAEFMEIFCCFLLVNGEDVIGGDDAEEDVIGVDNRDGIQVVFPEEGDGLFAVLVRVKGDETVVHEAADREIGVGDEDLADADVIEELALIVDDVDHPQGFAIRAVMADMVDDLGTGPVWADADVIGGHEAADAVGWVVEEHGGVAALGVGEEVEEFAGDGGRHFFEEGGAVVWREFCEGRMGLVLGHLLDEGVLLVGVECFEDFVSFGAGEDAIDEEAVAGWEVVKELDKA